MANRRPVRIWSTRQKPSKEPKFHQMNKLDGAGRSIKEAFKIRRSGWVFRSGWGI